MDSREQQLVDVEALIDRSQALKVSDRDILFGIDGDHPGIHIGCRMSDSS